MAKGKKKRTRRNVTVAVANIQATFNNTTVTITDTKGDTLCWSSAGTCGFKGSRKSPPFAGQMAAQQAADKASANNNVEMPTINTTTNLPKFSFSRETNTNITSPVRTIRIPSDSSYLDAQALSTVSTIHIFMMVLILVVCGQQQACCRRHRTKLPIILAQEEQ